MFLRLGCSSGIGQVFFCFFVAFWGQVESFESLGGIRVQGDDYFLKVFR